MIFGGVAIATRAQPAAAGAEPALALRDNVVAIKVTWEDGTVHDGFGLITGSRGNEIYTATANHLLRGDEPGQIAERVELRLRQLPGRTYVGELLNSHELGIDLGVVAASLPSEIVWVREQPYTYPPRAVTLNPTFSGAR